MKRIRLWALAPLLLVSACATKNSAVFVTSTSVSIFEGDTKPAGISVGYKRVEGYLGPNNADGSAPPVLASIESDARTFNPRIRQLYATGGAAAIAASADYEYEDEGAPSDRRLMFFGTSTNIGLTIGTTSNVPDSFAFGYKRKEFSLIPLVETSDGSAYLYPSVLASIDTTGDLGDRESIDGAGLRSSQFFATGEAARSMAERLRPVFIDRAQLSVGDAQRVMAGRALNCYAGVSLLDRVKVWEDADFHDLYFEDENESGSTLRRLKDDFSASVTDGTVTDPDRLYRADRRYTGFVFIDDAADSERLSALAEHRAFVCGLSRTNQAPENP